MDFITPKESSILNNIKLVDEIAILELTKVAFKYNSKMKREEVRSQLFKSKYDSFNVEKNELNLENYLSHISNISLKKQSNEYNWILINSDKDYLTSKYYLAPNPENMHEIINVLVNNLIIENSPIKIKYQQSTNMKYTDRIIIYTDEFSKENIENILDEISKTHSNLFIDCERAKSWIYKTDIPNVFKSTDDIGDVNTEKLIDLIIESKESYDFLYNEKNYFINKEESINKMKLLIGSILLRKGLLLSNDEKPIYINDINIKTSYDYKKMIMKSISMDTSGFYEAKFLSNKEGRNAYLDNFYSVSNNISIDGVEYRFLTPKQRRDEINKKLRLRKNNL